MTVYFLTGLGTDERVFRYLNLDLPDNYKTVHINWIQPEKKENLTAYAKRISEIIDDAAPFILIGLSFGGILANEIVQFKKPKKIILISSITSKDELPFYFRLAGKMKLNKFVPRKYFKKSSFLKYWIFGLKNKREKEILDEILSASNPDFSKWAINEILNWKHSLHHIPTIRIHGNKDKVLPITNFKPEYIIEKGGHLMVIINSDEISSILQRELSIIN